MNMVLLVSQMLIAVGSLSLWLLLRDKASAWLGSEVRITERVSERS